MTERTIPTGFDTGFEKSLIKSWEDWDDGGTEYIIFYNCELTDVLGLPTDKLYDVCITFNIFAVEVYDVNSEKLLLKKKLSVVVE